MKPLVARHARRVARAHRDLARDDEPACAMMTSARRVL
jgi:hypothetical protein